MIESNAKSMRRSMHTEGIKELLYSSYDSEHWNRVAERCLSCTNCTMVCPTCFCSNVEDITDLKGGYTERWRVWDSCFTNDFTYIHGNPSIRSSTASKYRHWIVHKLASWIDQFGTSGCVGCGRCITWCPVGIDITEEIASLRVSSNERRG
jgi:Fe-S-cluster-containing hydrogenase component 2